MENVYEYVEITTNDLTTAMKEIGIRLFFTKIDDFNYKLVKILKDGKEVLKYNCDHWYWKVGDTGKYSYAQNFKLIPQEKVKIKISDLL